jgi:segregation and condensation protein A
MADLTRAASSAPAAVVITEGPSVEASTRVQLDDFDGPLALLLSLIEARRLDVLTVPLAALADSYLDALASLAGDRMGNLSAFVAVASQLILIKSRALLPRRAEAAPDDTSLDEGTDPEAELRARLLLYRAYRDAGHALQERALAINSLFHREAATAEAAALAGARPSDAPPLDPRLLGDALETLLRLVPPPEPPPEIIPRIVTIAERAAIIRTVLHGAGVLVLQDLLRGVRDRVVVAVTFLALLELMKRREIVVEQAEPWGPILARATPALEAAGAPVEELA